MNIISKIIYISLFSILIITSTIDLKAQNRSNLRTDEVITTCEYLKNALDYSLLDTKEIQDSYLILVFYGGKGESNRLNQLRMKFIRKYLLFKDSSFNKMILSEVKETKFTPKIEIFVGGKLKWEIYLRKNKSGGTSCEE